MIDFNTVAFCTALVLIGVKALCALFGIEIGFFRHKIPVAPTILPHPGTEARCFVRLQDGSLHGMVAPEGVTFGTRIAKLGPVVGLCPAGPSIEAPSPQEIKTARELQFHAGAWG